MLQSIKQIKQLAQVQFQQRISTYDLGDDEIVSSLQSNAELRISYIRILGSLYNTFTIIDQLMSSFRSNLILDMMEQKSPQQVLDCKFPNRLEQVLELYNQKQYNFEEIDLSNFMINRYIQLVQYRSLSIYTENFKKTFGNGSYLLFKEETNVSFLRKTNHSLLQVYYVRSTNFCCQVTKVEQLHQGELAFNMGVAFNTCNANHTYNQLQNIFHLSKLDRSIIGLYIDRIIYKIQQLKLIYTDKKAKFQQNAIVINQSLQPQ